MNMQSTLGQDPELLLRDLEVFAPDPNVIKQAMQRIQEHVRQAELLAPEMGLRDLPLLKMLGDPVAKALVSLRKHVFEAKQRTKKVLWIPLGAAAAITATIVVVLVFQQYQDALSKASQTPWVVASVEGAAHLVRSGQKEAMANGSVLSPGDRIETDFGGSLSVTVQDQSEVRLDQLSQLQVVGTDAKSLCFEVAQGRVEGRLKNRKSKRALEFRHKQRRVKLIQGDIGLLRSSEKRLAVAALSSKGAVVQVDGNTVVIASKHQIRLRDDNLVPKPDALKKVVDVQMAQTKLLKASSNQLVLKGKTDPDVMLVVGRRRIPIGRKGAFVAKLALQPGAQKVQGVLTDAAGRHQKIVHQVQRVGVSTEWATPG